MVAIVIRKVVGAYWKRELLCDIAKIFISGVLAVAVYTAFNRFVPAFTHGYITFIIPLAACGICYIASLFFSGVLIRLIKRER